MMNTSDLIAVVGTVVTAIPVGILAYQIRLQRKELRNQAIERIFDDLVEDQNFRDKLRFIYYCSPENLVLSKLGSEERAMVEDVTARLDWLGYRVRKKFVSEQDTFELVGDVILRCAQQLQPHLIDQRKRRQEHENRAQKPLVYKADFDWIAKRAKLYDLSRRRPIRSRRHFRKLSLTELLAIEPLEIFGTTALLDTNPGSSLARRLKQWACQFVASYNGG